MSARTSLEKLIGFVEGKPVAMARLAQTLLARGDRQKAYELCRRATELAPDDAEVRALAMGVFSYGVPDWHFWILNDVPRNQAHEAALHSAVRPGSRVLEIGAGTGLFSMMAAQAGAKEVVACEGNVNVAAGAVEVIARNGLQDRVKVVAKHSSELQIGVDLGGPVDILLLGNAANNLVSDGILPALELAARHLLRPGAQIIPAKGAIRVALAEDHEFEKRHLGTVEGFDLTPFNRLVAHYAQIKTSGSRFSLRSDPGELFRFDFQSAGPFPEGRSTIDFTSHGGRINGITQWIRLEMDDVNHYENAPSNDSDAHAWSVLFYPFSRPIDTAVGDRLTVFGAHDRVLLRVWAKSAL